MNRRWFALVLIMSLIPGCSERSIKTTPSEALYETKPTDPVGFSLYDVPETGGALQVLSSEIPDTFGFRFMGSDLVIFSGYPETRLTVVDGCRFAHKAEAGLPLPLSPEAPDVAIDSNGITYVDDVSQELVSLNTALEETGRIPMPENCTSAVLSSDGQLLYYCTATTLRILDLHSGVDRPIREMAFPHQEITGLHCDGTVLQCSVTYEDGTDHTLFISGETGTLLYASAEELSLWSHGDLFFAVRMDGEYRELLSGSEDFGPSVLVTDPEPERVFPILEHRSAVLCTQVPGNRTALDIYHLETGIHVAYAELPEQYCVMDIQPDPQDGILWLLCRDQETDSTALLRWDLSGSGTKDSRRYLQPRWTEEEPDWEGLSACNELAEELAQKHGVQILLWAEISDFSTPDHLLVPEYQVPLLRRMLQELDGALSRYPEGFLKELTEPAESRKLTICLVRGINRADGSAADQVSLLHWDTSGAIYLVLTPEQVLAEQVHLLLSDLIASRVLGISDAYDGWDRSAPDNSGHRERVQLLAAAIADGQADHFSSGFMQSQLRQLCLGIREAFHSAETADSLPWEQYLKE